jgi:hypothetical protein
MLTYTLVLLVGVSLQEQDIRGSTAMTSIPQAFTLENCRAAGEKWKAEATEARERRPRYYCVAMR